MNSPSRRALLGFGAIAGAGAVVGAVAPAAVAAVPTSGSFVVHGRAMRRLTPSKGVGDALAVRGSLARDGVAVGEVFHSGHVVARTGGHGDDVVSVETQLFVLADGTIAGSGTVTHTGRGTFVVTGGTGSYAGARGSYTTRQTADPGGGGEAIYHFDLTTAV